MLRSVVVISFVSAIAVVVDDDASLKSLIQAKVREQMSIVEKAELALSDQTEMLDDKESALIQNYKSIVQGKVSLMQRVGDVEEVNYLTDRLSNIQYKMFVKHVKQVQKDMLASASRLAVILTQEGTAEGNTDAALFYRVLRDDTNSVIEKDRMQMSEMEQEFTEAQSNFKKLYQKLFLQLFDNRQSVAMLAKLLIESKCSVPFVEKNDTFWLAVKKPEEPTVKYEKDEEAVKEINPPMEFLQMLKENSDNEDLQKLSKCIFALDAGVSEWPQGADVYAKNFNCPAGFKQPCETEGTIMGFVPTIKPWYDRAKQQVALYTALMSVAMKTWLNRKERMLEAQDILSQKITENTALVKSYESKAQHHSTVASAFEKKADKSRKAHNAAVATAQSNSQTREERITALACLKLNIAKVAKEGGEAIELPIDCVFAPEPKILKECSVTCGSGNETVQVQIIQNMSHFGMKCPDNKVTYRYCTRIPCPTDCVMGPWEKSWSRCSKSCGGGEQYKRREIKQAPMNKGNRCGSTTTTQPCNMQACARFEWDVKMPINCENQATVEDGQCDIGTGKDARVNSILTGFELGKSVLKLYQEGSDAPGSCPDGWNKIVSIITASPISQGNNFDFKQVGVRDVLQPLDEKRYLALEKDMGNFYTEKNVTAYGKTFAVKTNRTEVSGEWKAKLKDVKYMEVDCPKGWFLNNIRIKNDGSSQPYGFSRMDDFVCIKRKGTPNEYDGKCIDHEINWFSMDILKKQTEFKCTGKGMIAGFRSDWRCQKKGGLSCIRSMKCCVMAFKTPQKAKNN